MIQQGALFSYGPNYSTLGRDLSGYVDRVLKGAKPPPLLLRADQVIE